MKNILAITGAIVPIAHALVNPAPSVTDTIAVKKLADNGFTPKPTAAPFHPDLFRRATGTSILGYLAPDNTCGFVDGKFGASKTCDIGQNCAAVVESGFYTMGCCATDACTWYGNCVDYAAYYSSSACDHGCDQDANTIKCKNSKYPYCYGYSVPGMSMGFYSCDSVTATTFDAFETTYDGETGAQTWLALRESDADSLLATSSLPKTNTGTVGLIAETTGTATARSGTETSTGSASGSSSSSSSSPAPTQEKKSTPIGAIAGGIVGGLAVIGGILGLVLFFLFKKKGQQQQPNYNSHDALTPGPNQDPRMSQYPPPAPQNQDPRMSQYPPPTPQSQAYQAPYTNTTYDAKYSQVTETPVSAQPPSSPAPAYSQPAYGVHEIGGNTAQAPPSQYAPSPVNSPPPQDSRVSMLPPQEQQGNGTYGQQYGGAPNGYPPQQAPAELGQTYGVPTQREGRPVYEAA